MDDDFIFEPDEKEKISIGFFVNTIAMVIFKIYLDFFKSDGNEVIRILAIILNIIMIIALAILTFFIKDDLSSFLLYFVIFIYVTFIPILAFGIILRPSLPGYIQNKYIACTIVQLISAHGVNGIKTEQED